jgi:hypothetical protein
VRRDRGQPTGHAIDLAMPTGVLVLGFVLRGFGFPFLHLGLSLGFGMVFFWEGFSRKKAGGNGLCSHWALCDLFYEYTYEFFLYLLQQGCTATGDLHFPPHSFFSLMQRGSARESRPHRPGDRWHVMRSSARLPLCRASAFQFMYRLPLRELLQPLGFELAVPPHSVLCHACCLEWPNAGRLDSTYRAFLKYIHSRPKGLSCTFVGRGLRHNLDWDQRRKRHDFCHHCRKET